MSSTAPIQLQEQLQLLPDLSNAAAYEAWRNSSLQVARVSRKVLADYLIAQNSEMALLRAALILGVDTGQFDTAYQLAGRLLLSEDKVIQLFGRYQMAFLTIRKGFTHDNQAPITAQMALPSLHELLDAVNKIVKPSPLSVELEMRICLALSEGYLVTEDFAEAQLYASRFALLAPIVGLQTMIYSSRSLVALCLHCLGQTKPALQIFKELYDTPGYDMYRPDTTFDFAHALFFEGDFAHVLKLTVLDNDLDQGFGAYFQGLRVCTLQVRDIHIQEELLANRFVPLVRMSKKLIQAFSLPLLHEDRQETFRKARAAASSFSYKKTTWRSGFENVLSSVCSIHAKDFGLVLTQLPTLSELQSYPLWGQVLGLSARIELALRINPKLEHRIPLMENIFALQELLNRSDVHLVMQMMPILQLLTPYSLACLSAMNGLNKVFVSLGETAILNLKARPIQVFGKSGLRPLQAAEFTLLSFEISVLPSRMGGGQLEVFTACLQHPYGENLFWYEPVPPARLILALLEAAEHEPVHQELLQSVAQKVYRTFGLLPQLQQTNSIPALNALEAILLKVLYGTAQTKEVWQVVEYFGGRL
jgi:tetratricopeptide (TPR) repeat protein